jgi:homoserine dehydrogenase
MNNTNKITIGLFGFGVVGEGIYQVLQQTPSLQASIKKICVKHPEKKRNAPASLFTTDAAELLQDKDINVIVELINDADDAYAIVTTALKGGKAVVSANKKLIAHHLPELLQLQEDYNVPFLYEAAVCGAIPIIRNLEEYYDNDLLRGICGIVNGSTNYILTKILAENLPYAKALQQAQDAGFAESDPTLDVGGFDAVNKLTILLAHAYGIVTHPDQLLALGITQINASDAVYAAEKGLQIKLTAQAKKLSNGKVAAFVLPQFVDASSKLYDVPNENNGVVIESSFSDKQFLYGKGAGRFPTASAVLSDISALRYQYRYEYRKLKTSLRTELTEDFYLRVFVSAGRDGDVAREAFEWIDEAYITNKRQFFIGVIRFDKLKAAAWLRKPQVSVLVCPNGIIESIEVRQLKKRSLELAGVNNLAGAYLFN